MLLEKIRSGSNMKVYTFGQPRVGNKQFDSVLKSQVVDTYRVVHNKDLVVHVPPCIPKPVVQTSCFSDGVLAFYPFNSLKEIFYNEAMTSFTQCSADEDKSCSDQFVFTSVGDHLTYFGVDVGSAHKS